MPEESPVNRFLPYGRHIVGDDDIAAVTAVLKSDWLTTGPTIGAFEEALAERVGARHAVVCSSGTAALHLAVAAAGLGVGDVAIVPTITFVASANCARHVGAEVRFADTDEDTGLMRPQDFEAALSGAGRARALVPVHLAGQCADLMALGALAHASGSIVIEDASHAIGTTYAADGRAHAVGACHHSDMCVFSFHAVKTVAMGEGGAVTTNDRTLAERMRRLSAHGITRAVDEFKGGGFAPDEVGEANPWYYELSELGYNYRASDLHCALGLSQLKKLDGFVARRQALSARYDERLAELSPKVRPHAKVMGCEPAWHLYVARFDFAALGRSRAEVMRFLRARGIGTQVHYIPVHHQPYYRQRYGEIRLPGGERYYAKALSLPLFAGMTEAEVDRVVDAVAELVDD